MPEPPTVVKTTLAAPTVPDGVTAVTEEELTLTSDVATVPPTVTLNVPLKFVPVMVMDVPPAIGPTDGDTKEITGAATYVKPPVNVSEPPRVVRTTLTAPADFAGVTTVTEVALTLVSDVPAVPPKATPLVFDKLVPVIVTVVPPDVGPVIGVNDVIVGAAT